MFILSSIEHENSLLTSDLVGYHRSSISPDDALFRDHAVQRRMISVDNFFVFSYF